MLRKFGHSEIISRASCPTASSGTIPSYVLEVSAMLMVAMISITSSMYPKPNISLAKDNVYLQLVEIFVKFHC